VSANSAAIESFISSSPDAWVEVSTRCQSIDIARVPDCQFFRLTPNKCWLADCDETQGSVHWIFETEGTTAAGILRGAAGSALVERTSLGRLGTRHEFAPLEAFSASDESVWITGEIVRAGRGVIVPAKSQTLCNPIRTGAT
jgi:hypothetical protein